MKPRKSERTLHLNCPFCLPKKGNFSTPRFKELFTDFNLSTQIITENDNWYVIPDDSPIVANHLLFVSKKHTHSWATLDKDVAQAFIPLRKLIILMFKQKFPSQEILFFEHGSGTDKAGLPIHCGACGTHTHTHIHAVPLNQNIIVNAVKYINQRIEKDIGTKPQTFGHNRPPRKSLSPYLYLSSRKTDSQIYFTSELHACFSVPTQYFRYLIGKYLNLPKKEWDYKAMSEHNSTLARQRIKKTLSFFQGKCLMTEKNIKQLSSPKV